MLARAGELNLVLTGIAFPLALGVGAIFAGIRLNRIPILGWAVAGLVDAIRMTPLLLHLFFVFYALPFVGITLSPYVAAITTMAVHYGAYESEIMRAAVRSVPSETIEACEVLGLRGVTRLRRVTLPLAMRFALPPTANTLLELFLGTSVVALVAVPDIVFKGLTSVETNSAGLSDVFLYVAAYFVIIGYPAILLLRRLERRYAI